MKLYIKEKVFSWTDKFYIKDESGRDKYMVEGELFSWGKKLHIYDMTGCEVAFIKQEVWSWLPRFYVYANDRQVADVRKEFSFFRPRYSIGGLGWEIEGSFWQHEYEITRSGVPIVTIRKEWCTWGDAYELNIRDPRDEIVALAVVLIIDCVSESSSSDAGVTISIG